MRYIIKAMLENENTVGNLNTEFKNKYRNDIVTSVFVKDNQILCKRNM